MEIDVKWPQTFNILCTLEKCLMQYTDFPFCKRYQQVFKFFSLG
jgi:hypothetical protein